MQLLHSTEEKIFKTKSGDLIALETSSIIGQNSVVRVATKDTFFNLQDVPENILSKEEKNILNKYLI